MHLTELTIFVSKLDPNRKIHLRQVLIRHRTCVRLQLLALGSLKFTQAARQQAWPDSGLR